MSYRLYVEGREVVCDTAAEVKALLEAIMPIVEVKTEWDKQSQKPKFGEVYSRPIPGGIETVYTEDEIARGSSTSRDGIVNLWRRNGWRDR